ncbi:MAG: hypothetical protein IKS10_04305 [Lachnospiraceae bacterium]|nr:hypothetical protein [Lachnospiraceae bacterium]
MNEHDLFDAIGNIDNKYIKNAEQADPASTHPVRKAPVEKNKNKELILDMEFNAQETTSVTPVKHPKQAANIITAILASAAVLLAFIGGAYAYKMYHKADVPVVGVSDTTTAAEIARNESLADTQAEAPTDAIAPTEAADHLTLPEEEITRIMISELTIGYSLTLYNQKDLDEFMKVFQSTSGTIVRDKVARDSSECKYMIHGYSHGKECFTYYLLSETDVRIRWLDYNGKMLHSEDTLPLYTYAKEKTDPIVMQGVFTNPSNAYGQAKTQYIILENLSVSNGYIGLDITSDDPLELVEVSCNVRYTNGPNLYISLGGGTELQGFEVPITNLKAIYVPAHMAQEIASHDRIIIRRGDIPYQMKKGNVQHMEGAFCLPAFTKDGNVEYLAIDNGKLVFPEGTSTDCPAGFAPLYSLNELVDLITQYSINGYAIRTKEAEMPLKKLSDGMSLEDVIEYFDAYKEWVDYLERDEQPSMETLAIPNDITKIVITDKAHENDVATLEDDTSIHEFQTLFNAFLGSVDQSKDDHEYRYLIQCYRDNEQFFELYVSYSYLIGINHNGTIKWMTSNSDIPDLCNYLDIKLEPFRSGPYNPTESPER